jgi:hypothetical protein
LRTTMYSEALLEKIKLNRSSIAMFGIMRRPPYVTHYELTGLRLIMGGGFWGGSGQWREEQKGSEVQVTVELCLWLCWWKSSAWILSFAFANCGRLSLNVLSILTWKRCRIVGWPLYSLNEKTSEVFCCMHSRFTRQRIAG